MAAFLAAIGGVTMFFSPYQGDDLAYAGLFGGVSPAYDSPLDYPLFVARHWFTTNGRVANYLLPGMTAWLPKAVNAVLCGLMQWLMYLGAVACSDVKRLGSARMLIACMALLLPWWDYMNIYACQLNYVWAAALVLWAVFAILKGKSLGGSTLVAAMLVVAVGAAMHEGASLALCTGFAAYLWAGWRPTRAQKWMLGAFAAGTVEVVCSPGILLRAAGDRLPDAPIETLVAVNVPLVLLMLVVLGVRSILRRGREREVAAAVSPSIVFVVAAVVSGVISVASGVIGRSGWFAEIFAMIVLVGIADNIGKRQLTMEIVSTLAYLGALAVGIMTCAWQMLFCSDYQNFLAVYEKADDKRIVFYDSMADDEVPRYIYGRAKGVPDADDFYLLECFGKYYDKEGRYPVVLPENARTMYNIDNFTLSDGSRITVFPPEGMRRHPDAPDSIPLHILDRGARTFAVQEFDRNGKKSYYISRRIVDPGDR